MTPLLPSFLSFFPLGLQEGASKSTSFTLQSNIAKTDCYERVSWTFFKPAARPTITYSCLKRGNHRINYTRGFISKSNLDFSVLNSNCLSNNMLKRTYVKNFQTILMPKVILAKKIVTKSYFYLTFLT